MPKPTKSESGPQAIDVKAFLTAIFRDLKPEHGVIAVSHPSDTGKGWPRWRYDPKRLPASKVLYYFPSSIKADNPRANRVTARADQFAMCFCIVLDDIGTKIKKDIPVPPSYILETSSRSFQYGYILKYPIAVAEANALIRALVAEGFTDAGRSNMAGHLMRVPGSHNVKTDPPFIGRLVEWHPDLRYSHNELAVGFDIVPDGSQPVRRDAVALLKPGQHDPVLDWLMAHGRITGDPDVRGWVPIQCPWEGGHTPGKNPGGTDYKPGSPGVWRCLHEHCEHRGASALRDWITEQDPKADIGILPRVLIEGAVAALRKALPAKVIEDVERGAHLEPLKDTDELVKHLAQRIRLIDLGPEILSDFDCSVKGTASRTQTTTAVRVLDVLDRIGVTLRYNSMNGAVEISMGTFKSTEDTTNAAMNLIVHACARCGMRNESAIYNAVDNLSKDRTFHPVEEWMESIPWDGTDRFKLFAETLVIGNQKHEKWRNQIVRRWLIQGAAAMRNYKHGKTKDIGYVLTIQGEQGVGKSRWVSSLVPPAFVSLGLSLRLTFNERDTVRRVTQTFIGELAELDHSFKHSDVTSTKTFLTAPVDTYRDAYARTITSRPRCTVFIGTVNPAGFLLDQTGNRRFWPVAVERCLYNHGIDMQQVWAQAGVLQAKGEQHWLTDDEERMHTEVTARHMAASDVQDIISDLSYRRKMFTDKSTWVHQSGKDLCTRYLVHSKMIVLMDLQAAMDRLKFERAKIHGKRGWWVPPQTLLTAGQRADLAGLVLVKGGKVDETRK